ncbi:hypothetical protein EVG20_g1282 [Dentipellis fragilis]|uniref:Uncharacterized protein n=1 Tax=Dentipellis fragilis TaxID=205917 RepID=A0A4Y9ZAB9_9AGAM|nr:hypothetical protein EVG20_g1282 [Dentipellis fragilis]
MTHAREPCLSYAHLLAAHSHLKPLGKCKQFFYASLLTAGVASAALACGKRPRIQRVFFTLLLRAPGFTVRPATTGQTSHSRGANDLFDLLLVHPEDDIPPCSAHCIAHLSLVSAVILCFVLLAREGSCDSIPNVHVSFLMSITFSSTQDGAGRCKFIGGHGGAFHRTPKPLHSTASTRPREGSRGSFLLVVNGSDTPSKLAHGIYLKRTLRAQWWRDLCPPVEAYSLAKEPLLHPISNLAGLSSHVKDDAQADILSHHQPPYPALLSTHASLVSYLVAFTASSGLGVAGGSGTGGPSLSNADPILAPTLIWNGIDKVLRMQELCGPP